MRRITSNPQEIIEEYGLYRVWVTGWKSEQWEVEARDEQHARRRWYDGERVDTDEGDFTVERVEVIREPRRRTIPSRPGMDRDI